MTASNFVRTQPMAPARSGHPSDGTRVRTLVIGVTAFLTLVDLFATQAILPSLAQAYRVSPAAMGFAVNASTIGMAIAGLGVAFFSQHIDRRRGIVASLALLAIPTSLLAVAPDLSTFTALRIAQGVFMSAAFTLTLSYLAEQCSMHDAAGAFAAYITGNVASNLLGRLLSAALADHLGLAANFRQAFALGFLILFAFLGIFTYVNFVLSRAPLGLAPMALGLVYFVFLPSIFTTPLAGRAVARFGTRRTLVAALAAAGAGLPLLLLAQLPAVLAGMVMVAAGTFFAQAATTGFVGRVATTDRASASGIYLACYFAGGLSGAAVLGQLFDRLGWAACVAGVGVALALGAMLAARLKTTD